MEALLHDVLVSDSVKQKKKRSAAASALLLAHIERVVGEMHGSTWFTFPPSSVLTHTTNGTRIGDLFVDSIFEFRHG